MQFRHFLAAAVMLPAAALSHAQNGSLNLLCSVQDEWCSLMATTFGRVSGIKVNVLKRGTGEALAQLAAEKDNPKTDIWNTSRRHCRSSTPGRRTRPASRATGPSASTPGR
jgi:hypothetical protein